MRNTQTILITGGAGFVGSSLAVAFRHDRPDVRVIALDNLSWRGSELNLPRLRAAGVDFIHGDVRQSQDLDGVGPFDVLIDCAAEPSVQAGLHSSPRVVFDINLGGTINCLEAARIHEAAFVFLSTSRVYPIAALNDVAWTEGDTRFSWTGIGPGVSPEGVSEDFPLAGSRSYYGASKLASELVAQEYAANAGMPLVINRCGVLTGPWQMGKVDQGVTALWVLRHHFEQSLQYIGFGGGGKQVRDLLHVNDLYQLLCRQLEGVSRWNGSIYNVGGGREVSVSLRELTQLCEHIVGREIPITPVTETSPVDLRLYLTDNAKVERDYGWRPTTSPAQIVESIHEWVLQNEGMLASGLGLAPRSRPHTVATNQSLA